MGTPGLNGQLIMPEPNRLIWYNLLVNTRRKKKTEERPVFESIRKPTAPAGQKFGGSRPEEKLLPSGRKAKHKKPPAPDTEL